MARRMFKKAVSLTRPPLRAKTRISPPKAAAFDCLSYCSILRFTLYEIHSTFQDDARTKLEDFFNILPNWAFHFLLFPGSLI